METVGRHCVAGAGRDVDRRDRAVHVGGACDGAARGRRRGRARHGIPRQLGCSAYFRRHRRGRELRARLGACRGPALADGINAPSRRRPARRARWSGSVASDRWMRTLSLYRLAERDYAALSSQSAEAARCVRARCQRLAGRAQPRLAARVHSAWVRAAASGGRADSLVWLKLMALRLSSDRRNELLRARLAGPAHARSRFGSFGPTTRRAHASRLERRRSR